MNKLKEVIKNDTAGVIGLGVALPMFLYSVAVWAPIAITILGLATIGLIYGLYDTYTKLK